MLKMEYTKNTLYVSLRGQVNKKGVLELKRKLFHILDDYDIGDIILDIRETSYIERETFYSFLDDYDKKYGGNLDVIG